MQTAFTLLRILNDGRFYSGAVLARELKISRSTIWKAIEYLRGQGLQIHAVPGRGYRWHAPLPLLDTQQIRSLLSPPTQAFFPKFELCAVIPSTNDYLAQRLSHGLPSGTVCLAEGQTAGKGRLGKSWCSPLGSNIYLSFYWRYTGTIQDMAPLTLVIGLAALEGLKTIQPLSESVGVKWPNDLWDGDAKWGGILVEHFPGAHNPQAHGGDLIIGIGIDVTNTQALAVDCAHTDLTGIWGKVPSRNTLIAALLNSFSVFLPQFQREGLKPFMDLWQQYDRLKNRTISFETPQGKQTGRADSINERGEYCVQLEHEVVALHSAEISLGKLSD